MGVYISRIWGEEIPQRIEPIFFLVKDIHDVIAHAKFGDDRLRGSGVVAGQISAFPIDFAGRPYNTLTLPCERVMGRRCVYWPIWSICLSCSVLSCGLLHLV